MATREWMWEAIAVLETLKYNKTKGKERKGKERKEANQTRKQNLEKEVRHTLKKQAISVAATMPIAPLAPASTPNSEPELLTE